MPHYTFEITATISVQTDSEGHARNKIKNMNFLQDDDSDGDWVQVYLPSDTAKEATLVDVDQEG